MYPHSHLEGKAVAGWLTHEIDAQREAAQLEFEREQGCHPSSSRGSTARSSTLLLRSAIEALHS